MGRVKFKKMERGEREKLDQSERILKSNSPWVGRFFVLIV